MKNKQMVTIGIPAHNEGANIAYLLESILKQKGDNFVIEKIYVLCDGCTDNTADKVRSLIKKHPIINLIDNKQREGKIARLNQFYQSNTSEIIVVLDADIILANQKVIKSLISSFNQKKIGLVAGNDQPLPGQTLIEKIANIQEQIWFEVRKNLNKGNSIHNCRARIFALRKELAKVMKIPQSINYDYLIYLSCLVNNSRFRYQKQAIVYYRSPDNINDYLTQFSRFNDSQVKKEIASYFGDWVTNLYRTPTKNRLLAPVKVFFLKPIFTPLAIIFLLWIKIFPVKKNKLHKRGQWSMVTSTKKGINVN